MWDKTNYEAQRKHMENAGLNPALLYGMGGGGGTSAAGAQGQGVSAVGGNEVSAGAQQAGMALQAGMMQSQIALNEANAKKAEAEAKKTEGVDTEQTKALTEINQKHNLEMWDKTNYEAQRKHMENAGLNPALIYGMGGGGGTSAAGGQGQGVSAVGGNGVSAGAQQAGMALQAGMMQSQIALNEANAKKAEADAAKTAGVDTDQVKALTELTKNQNLTETEKRNLIEIQQDLTWSEKALTDQKATTEVMNQGQLYHETELYKQKVIEKRAMEIKK